MSESKKPIEPKTVSVEEYDNACEDYQGWCPDCGEFTRDQTEPDADGYDCPACDGNNVVGAENALIMGLIEVDEDEDSDED